VELVIHLRMHDHYSIKRAFGKPRDYLLKAEEMGLKYLSITNYANDCAWPYYRSELNYLNNHGHNINVNFLYGVEFFITNDMTSKGRPNFEEINRGNDTIILMAKNNEGYVELLRILSDANLPENYFTVPRIDFDYLSDVNTENLVCLIPYDFGTIPKLIISGEDKKAKQLLGLFKSLFGNDLYFEITANISETNKYINKKVIEFAENNNIEMFASCNIHYPNKEDKKVHDVVLAFGEKKTFAENDLYSLGSSDHYLRSDDSVIQGLRRNEIRDDLIEILISNTEKIAVNCSFDLEIAPMTLPSVDIILPENYKGKPVEYFEYLIEKGWQELIIPRINSGEWDEIKSSDINVYEERKKYEYDMIKNIFTMKDPNNPMKNGFVEYFLIVADYAKWAKGIERRIMQDVPIIEVGPARGSVSGSIIGYLMKMSTVDPIPFGLTFERFINPERVSWPDVDLDFDPDYAWLVERYLIETYGYDHVAHIITFQTAAGKNAFQSVSKVLSGKYGKYKTEVKKDKWKSELELKKLLNLDSKQAREIQDIIDSQRSIAGQLNPESHEFNEQLYDYYKLSAYKEMFDIMARFEGLITSTGSHPAAVIITEKPVYYHTSRVNTDKYDDGYPLITTSYEKYALESVNTMKFDILRLRELTIVKACLKFIKESLGIDINLDRINPFDIESNKKILQIMKDGDLDGVFQFSSHLYKSIIEEVLSGVESRGEDEVAKDLFNIIIALEALGRPGPLEGGMVPTFASGLANPDEIEKVHPIVDKILEETYGNMLYQEQILFILRQLGGFSLGQADMVRRGIAATKIELIEEHRGNFIKGVERVQLEKNPNTTPEEMEELLKLANHIFDLMTKWAGYGFNKAHSVGYGFLSLRGAWLKVNYKPHFMAALMSANAGNEDKLTSYIDEIRARGINVLPPKINKSLKGFTVVGEEILFGLHAIKGVGEKAVEKIIIGYPYNNVMDFVIKAGNRTVLPPLIKAGYFEEDKKFLLKYWEVLIEIKDGKTKSEESLIDFILENGINRDNQMDIEKRLENIIYQKSLKKRVEKTRNECLNLIHREEYSHIDILTMEKETLGMFLSESPLDNFKDIIISQTTLCNNIKEHKVNEEFYVVGMVLETPPFRIDKNKNKMCFLKLQMYDGMVEVPVFAGAYEKYNARLTEGRIIIAKAKKIRGGVTLNQIADLVEKEMEFREFFGLKV
jgi:DNA polymerase-3 subunit alpha